MVTVRLAVGLAALGLLSACTQPADTLTPTPAATAPIPASASSQPGATASTGSAAFDGTYRSSTPTSNGTCDTTFSPVIRVRNGILTHVYNPSVRYSGPVGSDGSIYLQHDPTHILSGKFSNGQFEGYATAGNICRYQYLLTRQ